jgi:hypothetical protein
MGSRTRSKLNVTKKKKNKMKVFDRAHEIDAEKFAEIEIRMAELRQGLINC